MAGCVFSAVGWATFAAAAGPSKGFLLALLTINVFGGGGGGFGGGGTLFEVFGVGGQNFMAAKIEAAHTCAKLSGRSAVDTLPACEVNNAITATSRAHALDLVPLQPRKTCQDYTRSHTTPLPRANCTLEAT